MPLNANALVTLNQAKKYCDISLTDTSQDERIEQLINMASQLIETYTNRKLKSQVHVEYHDGRLQNTLILRQWPAQKPSEIKVDNSKQFGPNTIIDSSSYDVFNEMEVVYNSFFPKGFSNIKITYTAGYTTVPSDLQEACLMLVALYYQARTDKRIGINSKGKQGESISYIDGIPEHVMMIIEQYARNEFDYASSGINNS